jgi:hypothetical protein
VALGVAAACWLWHSYQPGRVTYDSYLAVQIGMTRAEVEQVLGPPADDAEAAWAVRRKSWDFQEQRFEPGTPRRKAPPWPDCTRDVWVGDAGKISVWYNADGKVFLASICTANPDKTWEAQLRRRLGR